MDAYPSLIINFTHVEGSLTISFNHADFRDGAYQVLLETMVTNQGIWSNDKCIVNTAHVRSIVKQDLH
jgi:hypothetical protein